MRLIDADALLEELWRIRQNLQMMDDTQTADKMMAGLRKAEEKIEDAPTIDAVEVIRCGKCRHYQGNHDVPGCAPCAFWGIGGVMWDDFCKRGERYDTD